MKLGATLEFRALTTPVPGLKPESTEPSTVRRASWLRPVPLIEEKVPPNQVRPSAVKVTTLTLPEMVEGENRGRHRRRW